MPPFFYLPNPVDVPRLPEVRSQCFEGERLVVYPVCGIRRKNLGECALWAACAQEGEVFACSLAPKNPKALPFYAYWKQFAEGLQLPVRFGVCDALEVTFPELIAQADNLITTSIAEGFGLAFLEACLWKKPLVGRNLPAITSDFQNIAFPGLHESIPIPLDWIDASAFKERMANALEMHYSSYGKSDAPVDAVWECWTESGKIDFGVLDESAQTEVIVHARRSPEARAYVGLELDRYTTRAEVLDKNRRLVVERYSADAYGERLYSAYKVLAGTQSGTAIGALDPEKVLQVSLRPEQFSLLRSVSPKKGLSKPFASVLK